MSDGRYQRQIAAWLFLCSALVFAMVVLGGATRLTGSGLSIVEWKPLMGVIPPTSEAQWREVFEQYRQFPEYQKKNFGMTLQEFKYIYAFEYAHRLLGRLIGMVFLLPFLYFLARGRIAAPMKPRLAALFVLGALQGALGWFMVMSGLVDEPHVSQYRLTAHLMLAILIFGYMLWLGLEMAATRPEPGSAPPLVPRLVTACIVLAAITMTSGGFVAGLKAGLAYNTFPLMAGRLIPAGLYGTSPWWLAAFENITTVQFNHRLLATATLVLVLVTWVAVLRGPTSAPVRLRAHLLLAAVLGQFALGIATLVNQVPATLGTAHQGGAVVVLAAMIWLRHGLPVGSPAGAINRPGATAIGGA